MKTNRDIRTDPRLLLLLGAGSVFRGLLDPEGLLREGLLRNLAYDTAKEQWGAKLVFPSGEELYCEGRFVREGGVFIDALTLRETKVEAYKVPFTSARTLLAGLGTLDKVPSRLRRLLAPIGPERAINAEFENRIKTYRAILDDALLWDTEPKNAKAPLELFEMRRATFDYNESNNPVGTAFAAVCALPEGQITLSSEADVYGLSTKKVVLEKNLGMSRHARVECWARKDGHRYPSIKAAFDLYDAIPVLYEKQRKKKIGIGKPKAR